MDGNRGQIKSEWTRQFPTVLSLQMEFVYQMSGFITFNLFDLYCHPQIQMGWAYALILLSWHSSVAPMALGRAAEPVRYLSMSSDPPSVRALPG